MKEYEVHGLESDAAFDERCRSLLEGRALEAPAPSDELFASNRRSLGLRLVGVAAVLLMATGVFLTLPDGETATREAETVTDPSANDQTVEREAILAEPEASEVPAEISMESTEVPSLPDGPSAAEATAKSSPTNPKLESAAPASNEEGLDPLSLDAQEEGVMDVDAHPGNLENSEISSDDAEGALEDALLENDQTIPVQEQAEPEEPNSETEAPVLRLPLTLPTGGGNN